MDQQPLSVESIIQRLLEVRGSKPGKNVQLAESEIRGLCFKSREIFLEQPILLELEAPVKVVGDIHGQYYDLMRLFEFGGFPPEANYLFLGNYVDFGKQSVETICLLLAYKIKYPENFFLLRGNHECASMNRENGFYDECKRRYNIRLWKTFTDCFNCLPVAAIVDEKIFCCHGGLSPDLQSMEQIHRMMRPTDVPDQGLLCDLLWADPDKETLGWGENDSGVSFTFGTEIVSKFLTKHDLDLICRGNQVVEDGYEFFAKRQLVTLFSAPNFRGEFDNAGAMVSIDEKLMISFQILKPQDKKAKLGRVHSPPIGLKANSNKPTSITIAWQPPHDINGIIRGYQVSYTPHGETECLQDVVGDTTSTELTSLKPHTKYTICVRAKTVDFGDYCTPITVDTPEDVPSPPIGLKTDGIKPTSITISWQPPHDVNGIIRGYQVSYTPHGETECLHDVVGDTTSIELTSLKPHTEYTIRVRAKTVDFGDYCTPITVDTPEDVWRCSITAEELNKWDEEHLRLLTVEIDSRRAQQIEYLGTRHCSVCRQEFGLIFKRGVQCPICLNKICNNCRITPRDPPPAFMCEVCAKKRVLDLHLSTRKSTMEQAAFKETHSASKPNFPTPPIGLKADSIKPTSITISWQPPHDVNGIIRGYQVSYTPHGETECLQDVVGDTTSTELTSLKPHTEYTICVRAKAVDFGDYCTAITVDTPEDGEDQNGEQALHVQVEAKLNLMAAQQKLNEEQNLSGHYRPECDRHLNDLGHTREELDMIRKELVDLKKEHTTCKTSWIAPRHNVILLQKSLGGGAWGYVVEGQFRGEQVAVKCIHEAIITEHVLKRMYREISTMAQMSHPNLVQFIAAVLDDQGGPMIITELLDTTLRKAYKDSLLNMGQCIDLFRDVASALSYLHELETPIIHRDVSTTNVLLKVVARDKWIAKLSDFGSANWARQACTMGEGAIVYTAPEAFPTHPSLDVKPQPQTTKIDVYSYGILVCEVTLREFPDPDHLHEMKEKMKTKHVLLHTLVIKCTEPMPDKRPTMAAVLNEVDTIRMKL